MSSEQSINSRTFKAVSTESIKEEVNPLKYGLGGGVSGLLMETLLHPVDTLRTVMQGNNKQYLSIRRQCQELYKEGGIRGFYRGLTPNMLTGFTAFSAQIYIYETLKRYLNKVDILPHEMSPFISGFVGGIVGDMLVIPLSLIKVRMQMNNFGYQNVVHGAKQIYYTEGFKRLFLGGEIFILTNGVLNGMTFGIYDLLKVLFKPYFNVEQGEANVAYTATASAFASAIAAFLTNPLQVCVTRVQMSDTSGLQKVDNLFSISKKIYRNEGAIGFFKGASGRVTHDIMAFALVLSMYEFLKVKFGIDLDDH